MNLLLDTHILLWYITGNETLAADWRSSIQSTDNQKWISMASLWEMAIKSSLGKLTLSAPLDQLIPEGFRILPIDLIHVLAYQRLPLHHRDPFDRMLIAQAQVENLTLMTHDANFRLYGIRLLS